MNSSISSQSDRSEGSQHSHHGRHCRETRGHMKINLPILKDEDTKDTVTYKSWRWDLTVYHQAGCCDHTLPHHTIWSLQGYPRELVRSSGTGITLDDVLIILDEHYNNAKVLDALNQELFQLQIGERNLYQTGCSFIKAPPSLSCFISGMPPSSLHGWVEAWPLLWRATPKAQGHGGLPEGQPTGEDILWISASCEGSQKGRLHGTLLKPYPW